LRANIFRLAFEGNGQQRNLFICAIAIQAYFFIFVHGFSNFVRHCEGVLPEAISKPQRRLLRREDQERSSQ
jgi:hypothetical protein